VNEEALAHWGAVAKKSKFACSFVVSDIRASPNGQGL